jgi:hypothetical protein
MPAHKHADLMAEYAEVAKRREDPWKEFECRAEGGLWMALPDEPVWIPDLQYRRKPKAITITVGDTEFHLPPICGWTWVDKENKIIIRFSDGVLLRGWRDLFQHILDNR